ncbi:CRISPR-associated endonuclease Cas1 [Turicimonas muris]|uniref:CRISPR-associated endonuclease Cas1 n=5 Tax=Turicimonas muris TaxID=1796652 RepID=A0A227KEK1_9BURK|nr:CRISPR-associated endonuclease Cas1 [Turicimonas muris]ANU65871.1 CRISPR-associated endonuclease Cas1 [Burkholderiales bacterium YL45]MBS4768301.1 CRISPR-associated endonuclease Cas1 [Burkholderiales bacterium]OXE45804.1 CRISPR-associated endonuclease Cas1 [Turicimonas muris]QQQ97031.1 CRISPR-associated endonuclease Cas1 [Turicimonas muris]
MRHLTISSVGSFVGLKGNLLVVKEDNRVIYEAPLSRLRTVRLERHIALSSDLVLACAARGIKLVFLDWRGVGVSELSGTYQHAVVKVRKSQFDFINSENSCSLAQEVIKTKIKNQRAVLLYFSKYLCKKGLPAGKLLKDKADDINPLLNAISSINTKETEWRDRLLGIEGRVSVHYWQALRDTHLLPSTFTNREGRGAQEITNAALNYAYAILQSYVHSALANAGLELYAGFLHVDRPGKPSLALDLMEEYRAWVVDRTIIKMKSCLEKGEDENRQLLDKNLKKQISDNIDAVMSGLVLYKGKKCRLENVLQRQVYRLCATFVGQKRYKGLTFKW